MAAKCKKCDPHEICEECPEWIFTLADLIMCMMGLFVVLWVLKPSPTPPPMGADGELNKQMARQAEVINGIKEIVGFGNVPLPASGEADDQPPDPKPPRKIGDGDKGTQHEKQDAAEGTDPQVQSIREGRTSAVGTRVDFARGEATLTPDDRRILDEIAKQIVGMRFVVVVKGHAARDDFGEKNPAAFMDISLRRAQAAADYLVQRGGVSPDILRVQGCSTYEPVRQRAYTADEQALNRRVEVFASDQVVRDLQDPRDASVKPLD